MSKPSGVILFCLSVLGTIYPDSSQVSAKPESAHATFGAALAAAAQLEPVATGLTNPLYLTSAKDGTDRRFIVEQGGVIKVLQPGATTTTVFLDITSRVLSGGERGLLGLAFHPDYAINGRFFVNYTRQPDGATALAEFHVSASDPNVADPTETVLLTIAQPFANHNGGMIEFGPDGFLYIGTGDGGSGFDPGNRAQNIDELLCKILRIDVDRPNGTVPYSSPPDNPFFGLTPGRDEIYAYGFRNPWRSSFDRATGGLYVGDVGQNSWEEIDLVTLGGNYGWRIFEGNHCTNIAPCDSSGLIFPIAEYGHTAGRCSITGGYVYRGGRSALLTGAYVYGDFCTGEIFMLSGGAQTVLLDTTLQIASFGEDEAGEIYVVGLGGTVHRITTAPPPPPCSYFIAPTSQSFAKDGGNDSLTMTTASDCRWLAASHADWMTITSANTGAGNGTITYAVSPNSGVPPRTGTIAIAGRTLTVTQESGCTFSIAPTSQGFAASGGSGSVGVTAANGCNWTATGNASWVTITSGNTGNGNGTITYSVATNTGTSPRSGTMTIAGLTFTVNQDAAPSSCAYSISPTKKSFSGSGGTGTVNVTTSSNCSWTAVSNASWIVIISGNNSSGNGTVTYSVAANTSSATRRGTITIANHTLTIKQSR